MESIGDFALNIIPTLDTIKLYAGITALDALTDIASKVFKIFKGAYGVVDDTADKLRDLAYVGRELNIPVEQIKVMENTMKKFGLNSEQAAGALRSIAKFRGGAPFGEFDTGLILKAGLLPTDFGKDWRKNLELLSQKYTATDNVNVRSAIAGLVPGLERMLTDPVRLRQYIAEAERQTKISGVDFDQVEKYGKAKGDFSIALDNLAIAMSNAALPGLASAISGLTEFLGQPDVRSFFSGIGKILSFTGEKVSDVVSEGKPVLQSSFIQNLRDQIADYLSSKQFYDIIKSNFDLKQNSVTAKEQAQQYINAKFNNNIPIQVNPKFNVQVVTDGTAADVKIEQEKYRTNINKTQNTYKTQRVGN